MAGGDGPGAGAGWRVFVSHTSELRDFPENAGRNTEAITLHEQTLATRERTLGPDHPSTLTSRNNLANAYRAAVRAAEADKLKQRPGD